jgi:hypothetical protein
MTFADLTMDGLSGFKPRPKGLTCVIIMCRLSQQIDTTNPIEKNNVLCIIPPRRRRGSASRVILFTQQPIP